MTDVLILDALAPSHAGPSLDVPHLAWPLRVDGGRLAVIEQDTLDDVRQCVHAYAHTPRGARPLSPEFGMPDPTFGPGIDAAQLTADLAQAEPRAAVTVEVTGPDAAGQQRVDIHVDLAE